MLYFFAIIGFVVCAFVGFAALKIFLFSRPTGKPARAYLNLINELKGMNDSGVADFLSEIILHRLIAESADAVPRNFFKHNGTFNENERLQVREVFWRMRDEHLKNNRLRAAHINDTLYLTCCALENLRYQKLGCQLWSQLSRGIPGLRTRLPDLIDVANDLWGCEIKQDDSLYSIDEIVPNGLRYY
jgi:hypothetical protein